MTFRARYTAPYLDGTVVEYLDVGAGMVSAGTIMRMLAAKEDTFTLPSDATLVYPIAHTLRLRVTLPTARAATVIALEGIQQLSGLTYTVDRGDGTTMTEIVASTAIPVTDDYATTNLLIRIASPVAATTYDINITGFTQSLQVEGLMIGGTSLVPGFNFDYGGMYREVDTSEVVSTGSGNSLRTINRTRGRQLQFTDVTEAEYKEMRNFFRNKLVNGFCLFEQNQTTTDDWYLAVVSVGAFRQPNFDGFSVDLETAEVNQWL
jgi:hypothetical protein